MLTSELSVSTSTSTLVNDRSPGRSEIAQYGGTRGGTFHGEIYIAARKPVLDYGIHSRMPGRDGKDHGEDSPKQACS